MELRHAVPLPDAHQQVQRATPAEVISADMMTTPPYPCDMSSTPRCCGMSAATASSMSQSHMEDRVRCIDARTGSAEHATVRQSQRCVP